MPKIINPDSIAIESLTSKLNGLESQFTALEKKHLVLQDSVQSLNQTILKADIATSFYDAHLATYTAIFTVIVAIVAASLAAYNIFGIFKPIRSELKEFKGITFPEHIQNLKDENQKQIDELKNVNKQLKDHAAEGISWGLKAMVSHYEVINEPKHVILFSLRFIDYLINFEDIETSIPDIIIYLDYIDSLSEHHYIRITDLEEFKVEIDQIIRSILNIDNFEINMKCLKCRQFLYDVDTTGEIKKINPPLASTKEESL